jgi:hypothetical protein
MLSPSCDVVVFLRGTDRLSLSCRIPLLPQTKTILQRIQTKLQEFVRSERGRLGPGGDRAPQGQGQGAAGSGELVWGAETNEVLRETRRISDSLSLPRLKQLEKIQQGSLGSVRTHSPSKMMSETGFNFRTFTRPYAQDFNLCSVAQVCRLECYRSSLSLQILFLKNLFL